MHACMGGTRGPLGTARHARHFMRACSPAALPAPAPRLCPCAALVPIYTSQPQQHAGGQGSTRLLLAARRSLVCPAQCRYLHAPFSQGALREAPLDGLAPAPLPTARSSSRTQSAKGQIAIWKAQGKEDVAGERRDAWRMVGGRVTRCEVDGWMDVNIS